MTTKTCNKCLKQKSITEFFRDKNNKTDGRYSICKECKREATYKWRNDNKDHYNEYMRSANKRRYPEARLQRYGISLDEHTAMLEAQGHKCAICKKLPQGKRPLVVDHDHKTKAVRGLLCYGCNRALHILDNIELLEAAMSYLEKDNK